MPENRIQDSSKDRAYFTMTPRLVGLLCEDPYEYTLWGIIKEIAGESGECYLSTEDLAALAMQSVGKTSQSRKRLIDIGLLEGEVRRDPGFQQPVWHLRVPDLWPRNLEMVAEITTIKDRVAFKRRQKSLHPMKASPHEEATTPGEEATTPDETKKKRIEPKEKPRQSRFSATDPLSLMIEIQDKRAARGELADRPMGWEKIRQDVWEVCQHFAALFNRPMPTLEGDYNTVTRSKVELQIDTWTGGAQLLLERCGDGRNGAFRALDIWHRDEWSAGRTSMTVTSPMSLVNVAPSFAEDQAPSIIKVGH
jgi:hypothetical protein